MHEQPVLSVGQREWLVQPGVALPNSIGFGFGFGFFFWFRIRIWFWFRIWVFRFKLWVGMFHHFRPNGSVLQHRRPANMHKQPVLCVGQCQWMV